MVEAHPASGQFKAIDGEHQVQLRLMQALAAAVEHGDEWNDVLDQLTQFSRAHFLSEEMLMRLYAYPEYADHVLDHERMSEWLQEIALRKGEPEATRQAVKALTAEFLRHIGCRDRLLHEYLDDL